jgi:hypothetical protein
MTAALKPLVPTTQLTAAATVLYTCPDSPVNRMTVVTALAVSNTDSSPRTVTIYNVPAGGTATVANQFFPGTLIPANTLWLAGVGEETGVVIVPAGGTIQGKADTTLKVNVTISGKEYT